MGALGALQGLALWAILDPWPRDPRRAALALALVFLVVVAGLVVHFARTGRDRARLLALASATGGLFAAVALWVGWQLPEVDAPFEGDSNRVWTWGLAAGIALYALGPFLQIHQRSGRLRFPYPALYRHSWNNAFVAGLGGMLAGVLWAVLALWGSLFRLIGIPFFAELFEEGFFAFPVTGAALGYGVAAAFESEATIVRLREIGQSLLRAILPLVAAVTLGFLGSLSFTGLAPLFATSSAAAILIAWLAVFVLLVNAEYLDGETRPPYGAALRRLVEAGVLVSPALAGIALHAVRLRVDQYGLTPDRVFAAVLAGVLGLYVLGYAGAVIARGEPWLPAIRRVNVTLAFVVIGVALALHTPMLDPIAWSTRSQLARLASGRTRAADFDFGALRFQLGRRGYDALLRLAEQPPGDDAATVAERIRTALDVGSYVEWQEAAAAVGPPAFALLPEGAPWPNGLERAVRRQKTSGWELRHCSATHTCLVIALDLDADGREEALVLPGDTGIWSEIAALSEVEPGEWRPLGRLKSGVAGPSSEQVRAWLDAAREGRARAVVPHHQDLELAGSRFRLLADEPSPPPRPCPEPAPSSSSGSASQRSPRC
jgi:hypothetical protein